MELSQLLRKDTYLESGIGLREPLSFASLVVARTRGPFLESPGNFTGPKSNIQIEI